MRHRRRATARALAGAAALRALAFAGHDPTRPLVRRQGGRGGSNRRSSLSNRARCAGSRPWRRDSRVAGTWRGDHATTRRGGLSGPSTGRCARAQPHRRLDILTRRRRRRCRRRHRRCRCICCRRRPSSARTCRTRTRGGVAPRVGAAPMGARQWRGRGGRGARGAPRPGRSSARRAATRRVGLLLLPQQPQVVLLLMCPHLSGRAGTNVTRNALDVLGSKLAEAIQETRVLLCRPVTGSAALLGATRRCTSRRWCRRRRRRCGWGCRRRRRRAARRRRHGG